MNRGEPNEVCRPIPTLDELLKRKGMSTYIVWNPTSKLPPTVAHADRGTAIKVAGRMAGQNQGEKFYVCKLVNVAELPRPASVTFLDLERIDEEEDEDYPF